MDLIDTVPAPLAADVSDPARSVTRSTSGLAACFAAAVAGLRAVSTDVSDFRAVDEATLLLLNQLAAEALRLTQIQLALVAGEIAHRSDPSLGSQGLAQRAGHRTAEQFVKISTGSTGRDAVAAVRTGILLGEIADGGRVDSLTGELQAPDQPWLGPVAIAVTAGTLSVAAAEAIRAGLGVPNSAITTDQLLQAAEQLCIVARSLDPDALGAAARQFRDELDLDGVALREEERRAKRSLRLFLTPDGMAKVVWIMDPETAAIARDVIDRATSPKLGGVRFVDEGQKLRAEEILKDDRTAEQLASDAFAQLLRLGADADPRFLLTSGAPVVRITATKAAVETRADLGRIEGFAAPVSIATVERLVCEGAVKSVVFNDSGLPLDVGRDQRLFTRRQREALAVKWGGCVAPGCERPPSWCEVHHINHWVRDHGRSDTADGVLLCRHHHLLFHNNGWEIDRDPGGGYWLTPPKEQDPEQKPTLLHPKSGNLRDLWREREGREVVNSHRKKCGSLEPRLLSRSQPVASIALADSQ
jgi:hypothetical protein